MLYSVLICIYIVDDLHLFRYISNGLQRRSEREHRERYFDQHGLPRGAGQESSILKTFPLKECDARVPSARHPDTDRENQRHCHLVATRSNTSTKPTPSAEHTPEMRDADLDPPDDALQRDSNPTLSYQAPHSDQSPVVALEQHTKPRLRCSTQE